MTCVLKILLPLFFRSYYIAQSFLAAKKWTETIALYERVLKHASQALKGCKKLKNLSKQVSIVTFSVIEGSE